MQGGISISVKPYRKQKPEKVPKYNITWEETLEAKPWQAKKRFPCFLKSTIVCT